MAAGLLQNETYNDNRVLVTSPSFGRQHRVSVVFFTAMRTGRDVRDASWCRTDYGIRRHACCWHRNWRRCPDSAPEVLAARRLQRFIDESAATSPASTASEAAQRSQHHDRHRRL